MYNIYTASNEMMNSMNTNTIVIGNGISIRTKICGKVIDSFDNVVRINNFRIKKFENNVGTKTDSWVINEAYVRETYNKFKVLDNGITSPNLFSFSSLPKIYSLFPFGGYSNYDDLINEFSNLPHFSSIIYFSKEMSKELSEKYDNTYKTWPSTGICALWYFKPCYFIGFDCLKNGLEHYYDNYIDRSYKGHSYEKEIRFLEFMISEKMIFSL